MITAPTVTLTLSREDAQELSDNLEASASDWEYTEGERIPYLDRVATAIHIALGAGQARGDAPDSGDEGEIR